MTVQNLMADLSGVLSNLKAPVSTRAPERCLDSLESVILEVRDVEDTIHQLLEMLESSQAAD